MALVLGVSLFLAVNYWIDHQSERGTEGIWAGKKDEKIVVSKLFIYPIKSCGGLEVESCRVVETGFEHDREWVLARQNEAGAWTMVTQREFNSLVLVKPKVVVEATSDHAATTFLFITAPNMPVLKVTRSFEREAVPICVWEGNVWGACQGDQAADWFTKYLNTKVRLFVKHPERVRALKAKHTPSDSLFSYGAPQTGFADGFPFLILSQESVDAFVKGITPNEARSVSFKNFRPNILVKGQQGYREDEWLHIKIGGDNSFFVNARCTRCEMTNYDPEVGHVSTTSTTTTLKELMKTRRVDKGAKYEPCMGVNATHASIGFEVRVGQSVQVVQCAIHDRRGIWNNGDFKTIKRYIE